MILRLISIVLIASTLSGQKIDVYSRPVRTLPDFDIDVIHYDIHLRIAEQEKSFFGQTTITFKSLKENLQTVPLHAETFSILTVKDGLNELDYNYQNGWLKIKTQKPLSKGEQKSFTIRYESIGKVVDPSQYGMGGAKVLGIGYFPETKDNPELVQSHNFPEGARHWFPSNDHPADKATSRIATTIRSDWKVLSNGMLTDTQYKGDSTTYVWDLNLPNSTYLYVMVAGPFKVIEDSHGDIPTNYWVYPKDVPHGMRSFHRTPEIMSFFEKEYGVPYPWPKMDQITIPGIGGGAESTTATILGDITIHDEKADKDFPSHWLVAHEAAHQWWGDFITMGDWHHAWLNESFGTYGEYLYSTHLNGHDEGKINLWKKKQAYLREYHNRYSRPMVFNQWKYPNQNFDSHIYPRGAAVLHMLRQMIGDNKFKNFQRTFLNRYAFGNPVTQDLIDVVNEFAEKDMTWFFNQWVLGAGHPIMEIDHKWEKGKLTINIKQVQEGRDFSIFQLPATVAFYNGANVKVEQIPINKKEHVFTFNLRKKPDLVRFDPQDELLYEATFPQSIDELIFQLKHDNVIGRAQAARRLKDHASNKKVLKALEKAARRDKQWFVREASLNSLSDYASIRLLVKQYKVEKHTQPRKTIISVLAKSDPEVALKLIRANLDLDESYVVQAEMIRQLGKIGLESDLMILHKYINIWSPRKILSKAAKQSTESIQDRS